LNVLYIRDKHIFGWVELWRGMDKIKDTYMLVIIIRTVRDMTTRKKGTKRKKENKEKGKR